MSCAVGRAIAVVVKAAHPVVWCIVAARLVRLFATVFFRRHDGFLVVWEEEKKLSPLHRRDNNVGVMRR